jgi:hypothetical protein
MILVVVEVVYFQLNATGRLVSEGGGLRALKSLKKCGFSIIRHYFTMSHSEQLSNFQAISGASEKEAKNWLEKSRWNLEVRISLDAV